MKNPKRKPAPPKRTKPPAVPALHVKRSAELWLDSFEQAVFVYLKDGDVQQVTAIERAHELANRVVDEFERRWPGIKL